MGPVTGPLGGTTARPAGYGTVSGAAELSGRPDQRARAILDPDPAPDEVSAADRVSAATRTGPPSETWPNTGMPPDGRPLAGAHAPHAAAPPFGRRGDLKLPSAQGPCVGARTARAAHGCDHAPRRRRRSRWSGHGAARGPRGVHGRVDRARCRPARVDHGGHPAVAGDRCRSAGHGRGRVRWRPAPVDHVRADRVAARAPHPRRRNHDLPPAVHRRGDGPRRPDGRGLGGLPVHLRTPGAGIPGPGTGPWPITRCS